VLVVGHHGLDLGATQVDTRAQWHKRTPFGVRPI
jgi:hypothetical protein